MNKFKSMNSAELLTSFNNGQGKTCDIPGFANIRDNVITYNGLIANITPSWLEAFTLMQLHKELKDSPAARQEKLFQVYNENRLSLNHTDVETTVKKALPNHVLTSDEYFNNCLKLAANYDTIQAIQNLTTVNPKATKEDLTRQLKEIATLIVSASQFSTFCVLLSKEMAFKQIAETLADKATVSILNDTTIQVTVKAVFVDDVIAQLAESGFTQTKVDFDAKTMSIVLTMVKEAV